MLKTMLKFAEEIDDISKQSPIVTDKKRILGLSGAHRTGKSLTGRELAKELNIPFRTANVSQSFESTDFSPSDCMTFGERMQFQSLILDDFEKFIIQTDIESPKGFITDRTPIDILAYLLANIDYTTSSIFDSAVKAFTEKCLRLALYFTDYVVILPAIDFSCEPGKNAKVYNSRVYQDSLTNIILGAYYRYYEELGIHYQGTSLIVIPEKITLSNLRTQFVLNSLKKFS